MNESMQKLITKELKNQETAVATGDLENAIQIGERVLKVLRELRPPQTPEPSLGYQRAPYRLYPS